MKPTRGYVLEHNSGALKKSVGAILVYTEYDTVTYFLEKDIKESDGWSVVPVRITREDPDR